MKYVVTGINRLTGVREAVSNPHSEWKAEELLARWKSRRSNRRAYIRLKVEPAAVEGGGNSVGGCIFPTGDENIPLRSKMCNSVKL